MKWRVCSGILLILLGSEFSTIAENKSQPVSNDIAISGTVNPPEEIRRQLQLPSTLAFELKVKMQAIEVSKEPVRSKATGSYSVFAKDPETEKVLLDTTTTYSAELLSEPYAALTQANQAVVAAIGAMFGGTNIFQITGTNIHLNKVGVDVHATDGSTAKTSAQADLDRAVVAMGNDYLEAERALLEGGEDFSAVLKQHASDSNIVMRAIVRNVLGMRSSIAPENLLALKILENTSQHYRKTEIGYPLPSITSGRLRLSIGPRAAEFLALRLLKETVSDRWQALGIIQYVADVKDPGAVELLGRFSEQAKDEKLRKEALEVLKASAQNSQIDAETKALAVPILIEDSKKPLIQELIMEQLKPSRRKSVGKAPKPVVSLRDGLKDVIKISPSPIVAATEHEGFYFYATGGARNQAGGLDSFLSGYAIRRNGQEILVWSIW